MGTPQHHRKRHSRSPEKKSRSKSPPNPRDLSVSQPVERNPSPRRLDPPSNPSSNQSSREPSPRLSPSPHKKSIRSSVSDFIGNHSGLSVPDLKVVHYSSPQIHGGGGSLADSKTSSLSKSMERLPRERKITMPPSVTAFELIARAGAFDVSRVVAAPRTKDDSVISPHNLRSCFIFL